MNGKTRLSLCRAQEGTAEYASGMLFAPMVEELTVTHRGDRLVGDLRLPPWPGPHSAVVFVEGSGPGGRDLGDWPLRLAAAGVPSLAYDKPRSGASSGAWSRHS